MAKINPNIGIQGYCEAGYADYDDYGKPFIRYCGRVGRWRPAGLLPYGTILCDDHYVTMLLGKKGGGDEP